MAAAADCVMTLFELFLTQVLPLVMNRPVMGPVSFAKRLARALAGTVYVDAHVIANWQLFTRSTKLLQSLCQTSTLPTTLVNAIVIGATS